VISFIKLVPCRRFAVCKRSLNGVEVVIFGKITGQHSRPQFHFPPLGSLAFWRTWGHLVAKVGTSKRGGKQWQSTPKNLPQIAEYQSRTSRLTEIWSLPKPAQGLNTNNNKISVLSSSAIFNFSINRLLHVSNYSFSIT